MLTDAARGVSGSTPFRFLILVEGHPASLVESALRHAAVAGLAPHDSQLVLVTQDEPSAADEAFGAQAVQRCGAGLPVVVRMESFNEALSQPHDSILAMALTTEETITRLTNFTLRMQNVGAHHQQGSPLDRPRNSGAPAALSHALLHEAAVAARRATDAPPPDSSTPSPTILRGTYIGSDRMLVHSSWGVPLIVPADDPFRTPRLLIDGHVDLPRRLFMRRHLGQGASVLHVDAGLGDETIYAAMQTGRRGRVVALEADPADYVFLEQNVRLARLDAIVTTLPVTLADRNGPEERTATQLWWGTYPAAQWVGLQHEPTPAPGQRSYVTHAMTPHEILPDRHGWDLVFVSQPAHCHSSLITLLPLMLQGRVGWFLGGFASRMIPPYLRQDVSHAFDQLVQAGHTIGALDDLGTSRELPGRTILEHPGFLNLTIARG